jgi:O-antigen biosynthesis protein
MLEWSGERFLPWIKDTQMHYEHLHRYFLAAQLAKGKAVLDLASGEGYGSYMLSQVAESVIGIEDNTESLSHAREIYVQKNLQFVQGSLLKVPIKDEKKFDLIVCFEAIKHIEKHKGFIAEAKRLLKDDGLFLVSTPINIASTDTYQYQNSFQVKDLYYDEFIRILKASFKNVSPLGQRVYAGSTIWMIPPQENSDYIEFSVKKSREEFVLGKFDEKIPLNIVALASDAKLEPHLSAVSSWLVDYSDSLFKDYQRQISELNNALRARDVQVSQLQIQMQQSITLKMQAKYQRIVEKICRNGTKRRYYYELGLTGTRVIINEGWRVFFRKSNNWIKMRRSSVSKRIDSLPPSKISPAQSRKICKQITFPKPSPEPEVSIVIPVYNKWQYTVNCLKSIADNTDGDFEVIVVDDASSDETARILPQITNLNFISKENNSGFVDTCNRGAEVSRGKYVLFLNNDTVVTKNWLAPLVNLIKNEKVGAVGSKLIYPNGTLQEAGAIIWNNGFGWNYGKGDNPDKPEYNFVREVDYCSGASLMVNRDLFKRIGGFAEIFKPGYYEDTDLCFSIRNLGYKVMYQPKSTVVHYEGITNGTETTTGTKHYQEVNRLKFVDKWNSILQNNHFNQDPGVHLLRARNRSSGQKILIIDHYVPTYDKDAGSVRMFYILKILTELGHQVTFIGDNLLPLEPYTQELQQFGVEIIYSPFVLSVGEYITKFSRNFNSIMICRPHIGIKYIDLIKSVSGSAKIIYDTVDLVFLRETRRASLENNATLLERANASKKVEMYLARNCDLTLVVSTVEKDLLLQEDKSLNVQVVSLIHQITSPQKQFVDRKGILFVGGFDHPPNIDAVKFFLEQIFPLIKRKISDIKFFIVGNNPPGQVLSMASEDVIVTGYVQDLFPYFDNCKVFVAPLRYGAGVKGKINQSMSYGLPVVTTTIGAEGIGLTDGHDALIADEPEIFADKVVKIYENVDLWNSISLNSMDLIKQNFSPEITRQKLNTIFSEKRHNTENANILRKMQEDWNLRAKKNYRHYVSQSSNEEDFENSGEMNVNEFIAKDLEIFTNGLNPRKMNVLEIGCGVGRMTKYLGNIFGEVYGVDISDEMIRLGNDRIKSRLNVHLFKNNGMDLSLFADDFFDFVFSFLVFQHIPDKNIILNYIKETQRVLKPDRLFKFQVQGYQGKEYLDMKKDTWQGATFSENEIVDLAGSLNFEIIRMTGQGTQYFWIILKKKSPIGAKLC